MQQRDRQFFEQRCFVTGVDLMPSLSGRRTDGARSCREPRRVPADRTISDGAEPRGSTPRACGCALVAPGSETASHEVSVTTHTLSGPPIAIELGSTYVADRAADAVPAPPRPARVLRFALLTVFGAPTNFVIYAFLLEFSALSAALATVVAALCVIVPKFALSKYWVWKQRGAEHLRREVAVYVAVTGGSLAFATTVAWLFEAQGAGNRLLVAANLGAFTLMWVVRFVILDRFAFRPAPAFDHR